ncbi:hypothetical protein BOTU111921_10505 [Bordetella tumbae]|uniref:Uncharacterized protein n=1 Tax=Bordetella genomosp. 4 TaxID=463044 RepID=A0A261UTE4_9BORD|nr:hypothetical protein [Bordetella genomosp. 4]OZI64602.1 hypothetical protein CAL20_02810 [Bordetella genomosp. 4]
MPSLHVFRGYRVPLEVITQVRQMILDTERTVDVDALVSVIKPKLIAVDPWFSTTREMAARLAVDSLLVDYARAGMLTRHPRRLSSPVWRRAQTAKAKP